MIQIYNTLTKQKEEFLPAGSKVRMFVCGPTVYDYIHVGNARTFVVFDVIAKYLRYQGYKLKYIQNITDIDDRIIRRAQETGEDWKEVAGKFEKIFLENMKNLKVSAVDDYPRATDHIKEIIRQVKALIDKGNAYLIEGDGYYFDLKTDPEYGKLSGRTAEMAEDAVSRIDESTGKRNKGDFCLWKFSKEDEPSWPADIGNGRPGWHIEDTAITEKYFGPQYEIHGGGQDLIFPHHEAEIAQQESASGLKPFVRFWLHAGFIVQKGEKMSKSRGVFLTAEDALKKYSPEALRFYFLSAHYRSPLDYAEENLKQAKAAVERLGEFIRRMRNIKKRDKATEKHKENSIDTLFGSSINVTDGVKKYFEESMDNDFNTPIALSSIFSFLTKINATFSPGSGGVGVSKKASLQIVQFLEEINGVLEIIPTEIEPLLPEVQKLIDEREGVRKQKDFARSDELREKIKNLGYEVEDTTYGPLVSRIK